MARVYFLYRSQKQSAALKVRLQFKIDNKFHQYEAKTQIHTSKEFWTETRNKQRGLSGIEKNEIADINKKLIPLEKFIIERFETEKPEPQQTDWLKEVLKEYYTPKPNEKTYSAYLVDFIDEYLSDKAALGELKPSQRKKITSTKNKLKRLQNENKKRYKIKEVNDDFKADYVEFCNKHTYSANTQSREFNRIKTICRYAYQKGIEVDKSLFNTGFKLKTEKVDKIYLENDEIEAIENANLKQDYLDNARDWLLISIYSGQRISDFMRFNSEMISTDKTGRSFIIFEQQKTKHDMYLPLRSEIKAILNKRNGEFPRKISHQKYNDFIKEVCKAAGLNTICKGKKRICVAKDKKKLSKSDYRDVVGEFEKWEIVTSHIGRRTFATLNYGVIPTPELMYFTGHTTEKEFLNYIVRPDYETAKRAFDSFNNANKPKEIPQLEVAHNNAINQ